MLMCPVIKLSHTHVLKCVFDAGLGKVVHAGVLEMLTLHWGTMTKQCTLLRNTWRSAKR